MPVHSCCSADVSDSNLQNWVNDIHRPCCAAWLHLTTYPRPFHFQSHSIEGFKRAQGLLLRELHCNSLILTRSARGDRSVQAADAAQARSWIGMKKAFNRVFSTYLFHTMALQNRRVFKSIASLVVLVVSSREINGAIFQRGNQLTVFYEILRCAFHKVPDVAF